MHFLSLLQTSTLQCIFLTLSSNPETSIISYLPGANHIKSLNTVRLKLHTISLYKGCSTQILWRAKNISTLTYWHIQETKFIGCNTFKECFYQRIRKINKIWGFTSHIWPADRMLCMSGLYTVSYNKNWSNSPARNLGPIFILTEVGPILIPRTIFVQSLSRI